MTDTVESPETLYCDAVLRPGNTNCAGCGMSLGLRWLDEALDGEKPTMVIPACCGIVTAGAFPTTAYGVPTAASTFASAPAVASGISVVYGLNNESNVVDVYVRYLRQKLGPDLIDTVRGVGYRMKADTSDATTSADE